MLSVRLTRQECCAFFRVRGRAENQLTEAEVNVILSNECVQVWCGGEFRVCIFSRRFAQERKCRIPGSRVLGSRVPGSTVFAIPSVGPRENESTTEILKLLGLGTHGARVSSRQTVRKQPFIDAFLLFRFSGGRCVISSLEDGGSYNSGAKLD